MSSPTLQTFVRSVKALSDKLYATYVEAIYLEHEKSISPQRPKDHDSSSGEQHAMVQSSRAIGPGNDTPVSAITSGSPSSLGNDSAASATTASSASTAMSSPTDSITAGREKETVSAFAGNLGLGLLNTAHTPFEFSALQTSTSQGRDERGLDTSQLSTCAILSPMTVINSSPTLTDNSPTPSFTDDNRAYCPLCSTSFSGTRQHRESNCRRHLKDKHHQGNKLCCTLCSWKGGRTDSLRKHRRSIHGIDDPRVRPSSSLKRQRKSATRKAPTPPSAIGAQVHEPSPSE